MLMFSADFENLRKHEKLFLFFLFDLVELVLHHIFANQDLAAPAQFSAWYQQNE